MPDVAPLRKPPPAPLPSTINGKSVAGRHRSRLRVLDAFRALEPGQRERLLLRCSKGIVYDGDQVAPDPRAFPTRHQRKRTDASGHELEVEVFGEPFDEPEAFGQRRAALEPDVDARVVQSTERVRAAVVLLDEAGCDACLARDDTKEVVELRGIVDKAHTGTICIADSTAICVAGVPLRCAISRSWCV